MDVSTSKKLLRTLVVIGVTGAIAGVGAFSAFTSQADNDNNKVTAGTVAIADNDGGGVLYDISNAKPSSTQTSCIRVNYTGSLAADVKLYTPSTIGALGPHVDLKIETGTQVTPSFPSCTDFVADVGGTIFDAALSTFPTSYATGVADLPGLASSWTNGSAVVYRVTATLGSDTPDSAQGAATGLHTLRWEARNQ